MTPSIDGVTHTFAEHGLYDGLFLMRDEETGTFWDHLTGEAVYGPGVGTTLEIANLLHSRVDLTLENHPDALIALSDRGIRTDEDMQPLSLLARVRGGLNRMFNSTIKEEGLGLRPWTLAWDSGSVKRGATTRMSELWPMAERCLTRFRGSGRWCFSTRLPLCCPPFMSMPRACGGTMTFSA